MEYTSKNGAGRFATTHWSIVQRAAGSSTEAKQQALEALCRTYWFPLYAYLRRQGYTADQCEDYVQAFFSRLLEKEYLKQVDPEKGRFRSFLLAAIRHFISNELAKQRTLKRGGRQKILSFDVETAEERYTIEPADTLSPQKLFERSWAMTVLADTMDRLQSEYAAKGKKELFEKLKGYITPQTDTSSYKLAAEQLKMDVSTAGVAIHRFRKRYRQFLREQIAQTVTEETLIDDEIRDLFSALG